MLNLKFIDCKLVHLRVSIIQDVRVYKWNVIESAVEYLRRQKYEF